MQALLLTLTPRQPLSLPYAHSHILQGLVYHLLSSDPAVSATVHDLRDDAGDAIKLFCFSDLIGRYRNESGKLYYSAQFSMEIRSAEDMLIGVIMEGLQQKTLVTVAGCPCTVRSVEMRERMFLSDEAVFTARTPVVLYRREDDFTRYFAPNEDEFYPLLANNLEKKYAAVFGRDYSGPLGIECLRCTADDKVVTRYKGTLITGYTGVFRIVADPDMLSVAYHCGLGGKNAMGFGFPKA